MRVLVFCLLLMGTEVLAQKTEGPPYLSEIGFDQKLNAQISFDLVFRDEAGQPVKLGRYFGSKPVILSLGYYECPMLCTVVLNGMLRAFNVLAFDIGREFQVVTVSIDPKETPELAHNKKQNYIKEYRGTGAQDGWHFLTGDESSIHQLAETIGFRYKYDPDTGQYAHAAGIVILTPDGRVARYQYGVDYSPRDMRLGLIEASASKIGSPVDQVLLYCLEYDPKTGKYGAVVMKLIRTGSLVTIVLLGGMVLVFLRRERRTRA